MAGKKKKAPKQEPEVKVEPVAESKPAIVPEQVVLRRGAGCGGAKKMLKSDYDKELKKERGGK